MRTEAPVRNRRGLFVFYMYIPEGIERCKKKFCLQWFWLYAP